ncbi:hypothetical protein B5U98_08950 [Bosea sp. Tri-39]|nr:hypothetical protein BLM15_22160 [Bosea sp. Tri-49]RXT22772.1 hypothetical protein B5U98_08950 [Bosea sp. Tri-39]RXT38241.1 hypothetical protein B5U99_08400 [Bosea sp. Tri-54]
MVGLVPIIHVFTSLIERRVHDVDARHKGEHDGGSAISEIAPQIAGLKAKSNLGGTITTKYHLVCQVAPCTVMMLLQSLHDRIRA